MDPCRGHIRGHADDISAPGIAAGAGERAGSRGARLGAWTCHHLETDVRRSHRRVAGRALLVAPLGGPRRPDRHPARLFP